MTRKGPTLHDVAAQAGVSIATVSRVVRNIERVAPATRRRVMDAISELGYLPNESGRALVNRRHNTLGLVVPGLVGPFFAEVVQGCTEAALEAQKSVLVFSTHLLPNAKDQVLALSGRVDGLAVMGGTLAASMLAQLRLTGCPLVLVSQHPEQGIPSVRVDNRTETQALARHLIETHGYRRFAIAGSISGSPDALDRWNAFTEVLDEAGIERPNEPIPVSFEYRSGPDVADYLLSLPILPEVLVCGNDEIAIGAIGALRTRGIRVPEDVAVTGWDDIVNAAHSAPSLTTVQQFTRQLGHHTARTLLALIAGEEVEHEYVLPTRLVVRESCGCPPGQDHLSAFHEQEQPVLSRKEA
jgi:LacI family transcriptional regulator